MPLIAVLDVKKIPNSNWNRVFVFALGVLQICIGALIIKYSGGAAASFGKFMIQSGVRDFFAAVFTPDVCDDL